MLVCILHHTVLIYRCTVILTFMRLKQRGKQSTVLFETLLFVFKSKPATISDFFFPIKGNQSLESTGRKSSSLVIGLASSPSHVLLTTRSTANTKQLPSAHTLYFTGFNLSD